jgi:hypothetical protein
MNTASIRTLRRTVLCTLPLWICAAAPIFADVSIRYQTDIKLAPFLPQQAKEQIQKQMEESGAGHYVLYMKDGKGLASMGAWSSMIDFPKQQIVVMNTAEHTICSLPVAELPDKMAAMMPQMPDEAKKAMAAMKVAFDTKKTGRTDTIQGIQAEEREMTISLELPLPGRDPQAAMTMKMVMQIWTAKPEEALRNQAIRELMGYNLYANHFMNPAAMMQQWTSTMPGIGEALKSMTEELSRAKAVMLRTHTAMYMQMPPEVQQKMAGQGGTQMDFSAPMMETTQEAVEVSSNKVSEAVFQIPADYKTTAAGEVLRSIMKSQTASMPVAGH